MRASKWWAWWLFAGACATEPQPIADPDAVCAPYSMAMPHGDPGIASIHCASTTSSDDLAIDIAATSMVGKFAIRFARTTSPAADQLVCATSSYSGHFWNFDDVDRLAHVRSRSDLTDDTPGDDNAQLYTDPTHATATLDTWNILCHTTFE